MIFMVFQMLDENCHLIQTIQEYQIKGKSQESLPWVDQWIFIGLVIPFCSMYEQFVWFGFYQVPADSS